MTNRHPFAVKCGGGHMVAAVDAMVWIVYEIDTIRRQS